MDLVVLDFVLFFFFGGSVMGSPDERDYDWRVFLEF